jgi:hypothetical protein
MEMKVHIEFTKNQLALLQPLFDAIKQGGGEDAILGQVFADGLSARVIPHEKVLKIQKVNTGKVQKDRYIYSSKP